MNSQDDKQGPMTTSKRSALTEKSSLPIITLAIVLSRITKRMATISGDIPTGSRPVVEKL